MLIQFACPRCTGAHGRCRAPRILDSVARSSMAEAPRQILGGWWRRVHAVLVKEFLQLRRDRITWVLIFLAPVAQLLLYGYAVNTTPRHMPTAVLLQEQSDLGRSILKALENTAFFSITHHARDLPELDRLIEIGGGAVRNRDTGGLRARGPPRRAAGAADDRGRDRSDRGQCRYRRARPRHAGRAASRPLRAERQRPALRCARAPSLQPGRASTRSISCRASSARS